MKAKKDVKAPHGHEKGEDLYNYDEPSDGEIEDDDDDDRQVNDSNTGKSTSQPGHVIELKAAIDTDDEEFHDNGHQNGDEEEEEEEGESPQTPPPQKDLSNSPQPKKEYNDSRNDRESKKSKHHHHSSSKKEKPSRSSKSSSVSSSSHRSAKVETTTEYEKPKLYLPKKYQEDGQWKGDKNNGGDFVKEASLEGGRKRRDSSILSSNSADANGYDGEYFKRMASRSKDIFHDPTDKGERKF